MFTFKSSGWLRKFIGNTREFRCGLPNCAQINGSKKRQLNIICKTQIVRTYAYIYILSICVDVYIYIYINMYVYIYIYMPLFVYCPTRVVSTMPTDFMSHLLRLPRIGSDFTRGKDAMTFNSFQWSNVNFRWPLKTLERPLEGVWE